jgi:hypothetical protein
MPQLGEAAKSEYIRGELLGLVAELEGSRRLTLVSDDGEAGLTLAPPRPPDPRLRKVCGQYHAPDHTILHLTCGHHQRVSAPRPAEIWVRCEECWPAPSNGAA